jgi:alkylated DNA repair dioxygenase AlkB
MSLFHPNFEENLLPYDGVLHYKHDLIASKESGDLFQNLLAETPWESDEIVLFGKRHVTKRKVAFYAEQEIIYNYSKVSKHPLAWTPELLKLKKLVEQSSGETFNSCLLNLYHDGEEGMSWHSDNEKELGPRPVIASISLGAERKFSWKHKVSKERFSLVLNAGSLLLMQGEMQKHWLHALPKTKKIKDARINLSFRLIQA